MPTLNWIGKDAVIKHHKDVPYRLLEPVAELSCGDAASGNLIVQGDNLHALKALLPRYAGQVKCIYIDPPYNTGNEDWEYNDNVNSPEIKKWLGEVVGKEGETLDRHDRWLCMMYPRLLLLKQFLHEKGVLLISIGDHEVHNLRAIMDEIFGTKKRLATFIWRTDGNFDNQAKIKNCHEYILMYALNPDKFPHPTVVDPSISAKSKLNKPFIRNTIVKNGPKNPTSEIAIPIGFPADFNDGTVKARIDQWPHYNFDLIIKDKVLTNEVIAKSGWSSKTLLIEFIENNFQPILDTKNQKTRFVLTKTGAIESIKEREKASHAISVISGVGSTQSQSVELSEMGFDFPYPKPTDLIKYLISLHNDTDTLVLDSFSGSGTTAHAVLKSNAEDDGNRRFILVEMDSKIAETVTAERNRRVIEGYTNAKGEQIEGLGGGFQFCRLSQEPLFTADGQIRADVSFAQLAEFVWFAETGTGFPSNPLSEGLSPLLGIHEGRAIYLLYNGILKDKSVNGGNVLTQPVYRLLPAFKGAKVIYAAAVRGSSWLQRERIVFKQTPYALAL
jgi:site-specific DNA-methyltransferase (adenine-specific)/adenine-specific DNA-methyltransferase